MFDSTRRQAVEQTEKLKMLFPQWDGLPFGDALAVNSLIDLLEKADKECRDRVFSLTAFPPHELSENHSLNEAVARVIAEWVAQGKDLSSAGSNSTSQTVV